MCTDSTTRGLRCSEQRWLSWGGGPGPPRVMPRLKGYVGIVGRAAWRGSVQAGCKQAQPVLDPRKVQMRLEGEAETRVCMVYSLREGFCPNEKGFKQVRKVGLQGSIQYAT